MAGSAFEAGVRLLALRDHSRAELGRKLKAKGYPAEEIEGALARLRELGYQDDLRFARLFAEGALKAGRCVGERLRRELKNRGLSGEIIQRVIEEARQEYPESDTLSQLVARRFSGFDPERAGEKEKRRVVNYLMRRGYGFEAIRNELGL